jgi:hypothetical protein
LQITENSTPFLSECFVSPDKHGHKYCVVVIKATFDVAGGHCQISETPVPFVYADEHHGDPGTTSIRYESDFAPVKSLVDVLVNASAVAPRGKPVTELLIGLDGPGIRKRALVKGDRNWYHGGGGIRASSPQPFLTMPIVWDRAFGGSDRSHDQTARHGTELRNHVGVGFHLNNEDRTIVGGSLPNIERPDNGMRLWSDKPDPLGFGPVGRGWQPRIAFAGTYDQRWMDETLPFLPEDFDDRYFQSAPLDQQVQRLVPGSVFVCENMDIGGRFDVRVPALDIPVRFIFTDRTEASAIVPDTLILEPGLCRIVVLGRTRVRLPRKLTALLEIQLGARKRQAPKNKPHYENLGEAVAALRRRRGQ